MIKNILDRLIGEECTAQFLAFEPQQKCLRLFISKGLSLGIVGGAVLVKLPQIVTIVAKNSVQGLSLPSTVLENVAILISLVYNYRLQNPFTTYGEGCFIFIQNLMILLLMSIYGQKNQVFGVFLVFGLVGYTLYHASPSLLAMVQASTIFIGIGSKLPQINLNFKNKSTGQLSLITTALQFLGTVARILTTLQEIDDSLILFSHFVASLLNGILLYQILSFGPKRKKE
jgi:uncharacterized protein with PQ loop repeat